MKEQEAVAALGALAHPMRLKAFRELVVAGPAGLTPGVLQERLEVPPATLSFHLRELNHAGLVTAERASRHIIYRAAFDRMDALLGYLTLNCCAGEPCAVTPTRAACGR
ncbi:MAG: metalloregulator ArsR/SmtB family transcription factor [Burkholderiales bacterium]|jgi:DNA-binding transcriptional ArsR family regulator